jgi:hypothetical protein
VYVLSNFLRTVTCPILIMMDFAVHVSFGACLQYVVLTNESLSSWTEEDFLDGIWSYYRSLDILHANAVIFSLQLKLLITQRSASGFDLFMMSEILPRLQLPHRINDSFHSRPCNYIAYSFFSYLIYLNLRSNVGNLSEAKGSWKSLKV